MPLEVSYGANIIRAYVSSSPWLAPQSNESPCPQPASSLASADYETEPVAYNGDLLGVPPRQRTVAENLDILNTAVSLLIRAALLAVRFAGRVRR